MVKLDRMLARAASLRSVDEEESILVSYEKRGKDVLVSLFFS